jgi:hypothetical protein
MDESEDSTAVTIPVCRDLVEAAEAPMGKLEQLELE